MRQQPAYAMHAFRAVKVLSIEAEEEKAAQAWIARWGDLALPTFTRALREGELWERQVAAFALGATGSRWAREQLLPLLAHEQAELRWAAALELGEMREEAAFPVLIDLLPEYLPPHPDLISDWYDAQHPRVAGLLGRWGKQEAVPALASTLARLWQGEQTLPAPKDFQSGWQYQDALAFALGELGAFAALKEVAATPARQKYWQVIGAMGYLNASQSLGLPVVDLFLASSPSVEQVALLALAAEVLQQHISWSQLEAEHMAEYYVQEYTGRWEVEAHSPGVS